MDVESDNAAEGLESREPSIEDLRDLCRGLNARGAEYVVVGGFAMRAAGYDRRTMDIDLVIRASAENEARVLAALISNARPARLRFARLMAFRSPSHLLACSGG